MQQDAIYEDKKTKDEVFKAKILKLVDDLKSVCANFGLGNDGNEFKIITQVFLYKFLNDKFRFEAKKINPNLRDNTTFYQNLKALSEDEYELLLIESDANVPRLQPEHLISHLHNLQNEIGFSEIFDDTLRSISRDNSAVFSVKSFSGAKDTLFDPLSNYITDPSQRDEFCKAIINKLFNFTFEESFEFNFGEKYDFFKDIFEYLIKDYNSDAGGKYAEYYTPNAVARIIASILVEQEVKKVKCYDPSVGSGSLLMSLAHTIGENRCTLYTEDISQKSSAMTRLNLILNDLTHSIPNVIKTNTLSTPYYFNEKFDYIVSNPPFKLDFSDFRSDLEADRFKERFFAGIPKIPNKDKKKMPIYLLFIQHIMYSLSEKGKAAIVVPTGFITAQSGIEKKIRERLIDKGWLRGVVSMPSNIFASTGTNVSVLFLDKNADKEHIVLMDASKLGTTIKDEKNNAQYSPMRKRKKLKLLSIKNKR